MRFDKSAPRLNYSLLILLAFVGILAFFIGSVFFPQNKDKVQSINFSDYQKLSEVVNVLNNGYTTNNGSTVESGFYYKDRLSSSKLEDSTIKGLLSGLEDSPTRYYNPQEYAQYKEAFAGNIYGIGIEISTTDNGPKISSVYEDTPASKAGLKKDDYILKVGDVDVSKLTSGEVATYIRGPEGSEVNVQIKRGDNSLSFKITRAKIYTSSIKFDSLTSTVCKIKITRFTDDSVDKWIQNWNAAIDKYKSNGCVKLLLDLRGNGGGYVDAAKYAIGEFVNDGTVIFGQKNRDGKITNTVSNRDAIAGSKANTGSYKTGSLRDTPITILVNSGSASASEIFSGALQSLNRAKLIGTNTYGKGSVQYTYELKTDTSALVYTVANWTLPNGQVIDQNFPIKPDFNISDSNTTDSDKDAQQIKALDILSHL